MFVQSKGAGLATEAFGRPDKGTILLVMGATASMVWWPEALCTALAAGGYRVIRFDHRDTGASTSGQPGEVTYGLDDMVDDLIAILDAYGADRAHLVGMSLGGYLGQMAAIRYPERILSLTLISSEPVGGEPFDNPGIGPEFMAHFGKAETLDWSDRAAVSDYMLGIARLSAGSAHPFDEARELARIHTEINRAPDIRTAFNHALLGGELAEGVDVRNLALPVLVIHGSEDPVIPLTAAEAIARQAPNARLVVLPHTGHELAAPDLPKIAETILSFVRKVGLR